MRTFDRTARRLALLVLVFVLALIAMTGTASAHAQLQGSDPPAGDVVATAPQQVTITLDESVEVAANAIQVFDDHLQRVDSARVTRVAGDGNRIQVGLRANLGNGTYTVSWHVSSADTHPVSGTFQFSVGAPSQVTGKVPGVGRNDSAAFLLGVMRGLGYAGLILAPGVLLVTLALWPAGLAYRRTRRMLYLGLALLGVSALGSMLLQGVAASGRPLSAMWSAPSSLDTHSRKFDTLYALRFYLLVLFGLVLVAAISTETKATARAAAVAVKPGRRPSKAAPAPAAGPLLPRWAMFAAIVASTLALMTTWALAGHAAAGMQTAAAIVADLVHVLAMTVWLGGLALLTITLRPAERAGDLAAVLPRFSRLAFSCVAVLVVTGSYQTWRDVGSLDALRSTHFGHLLLIKLGAVLVVLGLGYHARRWVQGQLSPPSGSWHLPRLIPKPVTVHAASAATFTGAPEAPAANAPLPLRRLQLGLAGEVAIAAVVLGVTAALVVSVPSRQSYVRPFTQTLMASGLQVAVRIDAPRVGDTVLHVTARSTDGTPIPVTGIRGSLTQPAAKIGPLPLRLPNATGATGNGKQDIGLTFPAKGRWVVQLTIQTSSFDATAFSITARVT